MWDFGISLMWEFVSLNTLTTQHQSLITIFEHEYIFSQAGRLRPK